MGMVCVTGVMLSQKDMAMLLGWQVASLCLHLWLALGLSAPRGVCA